MREAAGKIAAVVASDGRRLARDRTALFFVILVPAFIILLVGLSIGGIGTRLSIGVADKGSGPLGAELRQELSRSPRLRVHGYSDASSLRAAVRHLEVVAGVVIPPGYDTELRTGQIDAVPVQFVTDPRGQASLAARGPVEAVVEAQSGAANAAHFAAVTAAVPFDAAYRRARALASVGGGVQVDVSTASGRAPLPQGFSYTAPSNLILFMFITSLAAAATIVRARRLGITRRMLATPTSRTTILIGQAGSRFLMAVFQGVFILVLGRLVFGVQWGDAAAAGLLVLMFALVATGAALLIGTLTSTEEQTSALGSAFGIGLGMLGGCMWPLLIVPPIMRGIGHATPHAWAMDGFIELIGRGGHLADIAPNLLALAAFAGVLLGAGAWRLRRSIAG